MKAVCNRSETTPPTVRDYVKRGLIAAERDSNGNWLFGPEAPEQIRRIKAQRMARVGASATA